MKITSATLKGGAELHFGDFNVFIGGNGVGKSTLMSEIFSKTSERHREKYRWIDNLFYTSTDLDGDIERLKGSLQKQYEGASFYFLSTATKNLDGNPDHESNSRYGPGEVDLLLKNGPQQVFANFKYRRPFVAYSSCDARLGLQNEVGLNPLSQAPSDPVNVLYRNRKVLRDIDTTLHERFGIHFSILNHSGTNLQLGISKEAPPEFNSHVDDLQSEFERLEAWKRQNFDPIGESGHGIRSMIRLLTTLVDPVHTVIMIDEPEMHLYPTHKRWLGRELVRLAKERAKQVFLVTHDPIVLQGILDFNQETSIIRIDRVPPNSGTARSCKLEIFKDTSSTKNQEQYLQGLFYQRCVVVEGASDRSMYQRFLERLPTAQDKDIGFVACGGKGGIVPMASLVAKIGLKAAFVLDFDALLFDTMPVRRVYEELGGQGDPLQPLWAALAAEATVAPHVGKGDSTSVKALNGAVKKLTGYTPRYGVSGKWATDNKHLIDQVTTTLKSLGIFIVPNGELESWAPMVEEKARFAEIAPDAIEADLAQKNRIEEFLSAVTAWLVAT